MYLAVMHSLFSEIFLPLTLGIITLGMGLSLTDRDFRNIFAPSEGCHHRAPQPDVAATPDCLYNWPNK